MPPEVALALTLGFIACLFVRDVAERPNISFALWIPLLWMLIIGSRFVSEWMNGDLTDAAALRDGSPLDAAVFLALILGGFLVLLRRRVSLLRVVGSNVLLTTFLVYCLVSVLWSDFPFVALKRWFKIVGHPIMALVVLTEPDPAEAVRRLMKRSAYVLMPMSILLIKYYPEIGRGYEPWTGQPSNLGITTNKNTLGCDALVLGLFFIYHALWIRGREKLRQWRSEIALTAGFLWMTWWLVSSAGSQTSTVSLLAGAIVMICLGFGWVRRYPGTCLISVAIVLAVGELAFGLYAFVIEGLGRNLTLTDRTQLWGEVLKVGTNPLVGAGFESFWLGERLEELWKIFPFQPVQAHNGYIETYLNLGLIGVLLLVMLLIATFWKAKRALTSDETFGRFRMGFLMAVVLFNYTEASFKALHLVWFVFYIIALDYRRDRGVPLAVPASPRRGPLARVLTGGALAGVRSPSSRGELKPHTPVAARTIRTGAHQQGGSVPPAVQLPWRYGRPE
jgi:O-antigen ligase